MFKSFARWLVPGVIVVVGATALTVKATQAEIVSDEQVRSVAGMEEQGDDWAKIAMADRELVPGIAASSQNHIDSARNEPVPPNGLSDLETRNLQLAGTFASSTTLELVSELPHQSDSNRSVNWSDVWTSKLGSALLADLGSSNEYRRVSLAVLDTGAGTATNDHRALTRAPTFAMAQAIAQDVEPSGDIVVLEAPKVDDFHLTGDVSTGGTLNFAGNVPDEVTRQYLTALPRANVTKLMLARGGPSRFQSGLEFAVSALQKMSQGHFTIEGNKIELRGVASSADTYKSLVRLAQSGAPQGFQLASSNIEAPRAAPFTWSATKSADGKVSLQGYVPDAKTRSNLLAAIKQLGADGTSFASGEPKRFQSLATLGLSLLNSVDSGSIEYDGTGWTLSGQARDAAAFGTLQAAFAAQNLKAEGWSLAVTGPEPAKITPYIWSATRDASGAVAFAGTWPTDTLQKFIGARVGQVGADKTTIDAAAPEGFTQDVLAATDALSKLSSGRVAFDGKQWSISGEMQAGVTEAVIDGALSAAATPGGSWIKQLATKLPGPVAEVPATPPVDPTYSFSATRSGSGPVIMAGQVPAEPARRYFAVITGSSADALAIAPNAPADFLTAAEGGLRTLMTLNEGKLAFANGKWSLSGRVADQPGRDAVTKAIAALPNGSAWTLDIAAPAAVEACRAAITDFSQTQTILFKSGASVIVDDSKLALDVLAKDLALCPDNIVEIEGHTDADGDADANLALSVARAEAVIRALIDRNILAARLYAVGYGEAKPIASNETDAGKRQNRRIVVNVLDHHY